MRYATLILYNNQPVLSIYFPHFDKIFNKKPNITPRLITFLPSLAVLRTSINTAMRELFLQIVYGRTQSAFSEDGLTIGAGLEDLGKGLRSQVGTMYGTKLKGARYLEMAEGYVIALALDKNNEICGYKFVSLGKMTDFIKKGLTPNEAYEKAIGTYGRYSKENGAVKHIDPRTDKEVD